MAPKDLKCPFKWEERRPIIDKGVLFVPRYYEQHREWLFPGWKNPEVFGNDREVFIEYCSGNGAWIVQKALAWPHLNWVAVERQFERVRKIWSKKCNFALSNLWVVCGEALTFTREYLPPHCVQGIYVNFPDPWPKNKHAKNRLIQSEFVGELARIVKPNGSATLATDDPSYCKQMVEEFLRNRAWSSSFPSPFFTTHWPDYGTSYFDALWREQGREIHYLNFTNT